MPKKIIKKNTPRKKVEEVFANTQAPEMMTYQKPQTTQNNNLVTILLIVVSFFAGYLFFKVKNLEQKTTTANQQTQQAPQRPQVSLNQIKKFFSKDFLSFGDANKKILFVEISDPSCPFCHIAGGKNPELSKQVNTRFQYETDGGTYKPPVTEMKKLVDDGKASYVMLYGNGHGNGRLAAQALYCAYEKGKFWEVHDMFMSNAGYELINNKVKNDKANSQLLADFVANQIDSTFLKTCLESGKYEERLKRDEQVDQTLGFQGTPDFFVNTANFNGAQDFKEMESVVAAALK